jgi:hypothetical protein
MSLVMVVLVAVMHLGQSLRLLAQLDQAVVQRQFFGFWFFSQDGFV